MRTTWRLTNLATALALGGLLTFGSLSARADENKSGDKDQGSQQQVGKAWRGSGHCQAREGHACHDGRSGAEAACDGKVFRAKAGDAKQRAGGKCEFNSAHGEYSHHGYARACKGDSCGAKAAAHGSKGKSCHAKACKGESCEAKAAAHGKSGRGHGDHHKGCRHHHHHCGGHGS